MAETKKAPAGGAKAWALVGLAAALFAVVGWRAWLGKLGIPVLFLLIVASVLYFGGRRGLEKAARASMDQAAKVAFTLVGGVALLRHPIPTGELGPDGVELRLPVYEAIADYIGQVDAQTFVVFALAAMAIKFVGVISSAYAWHLLLVGQGIRYPFWSTIMTSFLIGRFIGTFMPSTIGLDGYTLYEAGRYSNQWSRAIIAKGLEKFIGVTGLFLGMVLTLPFGYQVLVDVAHGLGRPQAAPMLAAATLAVAGGISGAVILGLIRPGLIVRLVELASRLAGAVGGALRLTALTNRLVVVTRAFTQAVGAYRGQLGLLMLTLFSKFVTHFTTAVVYYFTALAIGVATAKFWPIVFGSTIQILGTLVAPTIAGEGAREAFQALLLQKQLGGVAQAVLSGALGFIAAEAATLWGGAFIWTRTAAWRPKFTLVDGKQVDYAWISGDDGGFDAEKIARIQREHTGQAPRADQ